jgi:hypothetical protein
MDHHRFNNCLMTIEEQNTTIQNTLHEHSQWQDTMGEAIANIQQNQNWDYLFQNFNIHPPH